MGKTSATYKYIAMLKIDAGRTADGWPYRCATILGANQTWH